MTAIRFDTARVYSCYQGKKMPQTRNTAPPCGIQALHIESEILPVPARMTLLCLAEQRIQQDIPFYADRCTGADYI
jgi:hypothetical protein